jgi:hypothetical protein
MPRNADRLAHVAAALRPEKPPWYVRAAELAPGLETTFPADGWYWIPRGMHTAVYLGRSSGVAEHILRRELEREEREAA